MAGESYGEASDSFVRTKVFIELEKDFESYLKDDMIRLICLLGPKGVGKTSAMKELRKKYPGSFIDLAGTTAVDEIEVRRNIVYLDNAQQYDKETTGLHPSVLRTKFVVAAFSPGSLARDTHHGLCKACGDGRSADFYFRPFNREEALKISELLGFNIGDDDSRETKTITQAKFNWLFYITQGIPRLMWMYFKTFDTKLMEQTLYKQYNQAEEHQNRINIPVSSEAIDQSIINLYVSGRCDASSPAVFLGLAYCIKNSGMSEYKLASAYYALRAYERLREVHFTSGWQKLEALTQLLCISTDCEVINTYSTKILPRAGTCVHQQNIGDTCTEKIQDGVVTLLVLAENHNVIDFILYDMRGPSSNHEVFFIQTSLSNYAKKVNAGKDKRACEQHVVKKNRVEKSECSIALHYTLSKRVSKYHYVFATMDMDKWKTHSDVYFLDLLKLNPTNFRMI